MILSARHLKGLADDKLLVLVEDLEYLLGSATVTSLYREGDTGVHGTVPVRGVDCRCRNLEVGEAIAKWLNSRHVYDPARPNMQCAVAHDAGSGPHLHLQVHPNTRLRFTSEVT